MRATHVYIARGSDLLQGVSRKIPDGRNFAAGFEG